jgi:hypothetical protein
MISRAIDGVPDIDFLPSVQLAAGVLIGDAMPQSVGAVITSLQTFNLIPAVVTSPTTKEALFVRTR